MKEEWKDVPGYEGLYTVSNLGKLKSVGRVVKCIGKRKFTVSESIKKQTMKNGYLGWTLYKKNVGKFIYTHRLMCTVFIGEIPEGFQVHHKNGNRKDNKVSNLQRIRADKHTSLHSKGEKNAACMLNERKVIEIRKLHKLGHTYTALCEKYGVSYHTVRLAVLRKTWSHI